MASGVTILDGGMGRELLRMGAPFRQPEWSALALIEAPELVGRAHSTFLDAGAQIVTTNSYALVPFHIGPERFATQGQALAELAGRIARAAADEHGGGASVAGSLPPLFGSYRPDLFDPEAAPDLLRTLVAGLSPHVDLWLGETLSATAEAAVIRQVLGSDRRPLWLSFTLADELTDGRARLRSGEHVARAAAEARALGAAALLFNCSPPEVMAEAIAEAATALAGSRMRLGAYANAFAATGHGAANAGLSPLRTDTGPARYLELARSWTASGASVIGGGCGIGPEHIRELAASLS